MSKADMATGSDPTVHVGPAPDHPEPCPLYGEKWVHRRYQAVLTASSSSVTGGVTFKGADFSLPGSFFVDKVQVWKLTQVSGKPGLFAFFYTVKNTDLGGNAVTATDYGTATSLAGMTFKVPDGHAVEVDDLNQSLVDCNPAVGTDKETYCCNLHCWVRI